MMQILSVRILKGAVQWKHQWSLCSNGAWTAGGKETDDIPSRIHTKGAGVEAGPNTEYVQENVELAPTEPKEQHHSEF